MASRRRRPSLVEQVRDCLLEDLVSGRLVPGDKLDNENELAERSGVSRATVCDTVRALIDAGYLTRRHGSGTYVTHSPRTRHPLETPVSYTAMIRESGHRPAEHILSKGVRVPDDRERHRLGLTNGAPVVEIEHTSRRGGAGIQGEVQGISPYRISLEAVILHGCRRTCSATAISRRSARSPSGRGRATPARCATGAL